MRGKRRAALLMIFTMGLGVATGVVAEEQSNSQHTQQKTEKAATKNTQTSGEPIQPFKPSKEISADSVISLPTDI